MSNGDERCETCRFALRVDESKWVCRRYPPVFVLNYIAGDGTAWESRDDGAKAEASASLTGDCEQPEVLPVDWCGEWEGKAV